MPENKKRMAENARGDGAEATAAALRGIPVSPGVVIGPVFLFGDILGEVEARRIQPSEVEAEIARLDDAVKLVKKELTSDIERISSELGDSEAGIFLVHAMILEDAKFLDTMRSGIRTDLLNAESVVAAEMKRMSSVLMASDDSYLRDRSYDITDIGKRMIERMLGVWAHCPLTHPMIVVANELRASDTVSMDRGRVLGFVTEHGGREAHAAILSRALGVPAVVGVPSITGLVRSGELLIVDGNTGEVFVNPSPEMLDRYSTKQEEEAVAWAALSPFVEKSTSMSDGVRVKLMANISSVEEARDAAAVNVDGIGLFRTEMLFMAAGLGVSENEQYEVYRSVAEIMGKKPVTIRTLDIGGDKFVGPENPLQEHNPHLGYRSIRVLLDNPELFIRQMRAILRAGLHGNVRILWPMISCVDELRAAKICLEDAKRTLTEGGVEYQEDVPIGAMIEIPSAVMVADRLAAESDFLSIGTNDLVQYTLAVDRGNVKVDHLYRPHDPAVLAMIQRTVESGLVADVPVSVCGEMAGTASYIPLLLGLGVRELSATPNRVLLARRSICETDSREARGLAERVISAATVAEAGEILGISSPRG